MSILMNEIKSSLYCFGDSVVTNLHGIGSSFRISHNLNSLDRRINKLDRIRKAYSEACAVEPEVETPHPEEKSKVVFDEKEVSETVEFEENSNVIKKPAEEKVKPVKEEKEPVKEEPKTEEKPVETTAESIKEEKIEEVVTKPAEEETPKEEPKVETTVEKEPGPAVQQAEAKPKVELKKEDIDKIINIASLQSKTEHKDTAKMVADSIISDIINNPNSDLNQKLASNIEQMTKKEEESKEQVQPKATTKTPTSRKSGAPRKRK